MPEEVDNLTNPSRPNTPRTTNTVPITSAKARAAHSARVLSTCGCESTTSCGVFTIPSSPRDWLFASTSACLHLLQYELCSGFSTPQLGHLIAILPTSKFPGATKRFAIMRQKAIRPCIVEIFQVVEIFKDEFSSITEKHASRSRGRLTRRDSDNFQSACCVADLCLVIFTWRSTSGCGVTLSVVGA